MNNRVEVSKISDVSAGLVLKRKEAKTQSEITKIYKTITLKSFNENGWIDLKYLDEYKSRKLLDDRYITKENDILIRLSNPYTAIKVKPTEVGLVVPSLFGIIKVNQKDIVSGYLSFILNSDKTKQTYFKNSMGITIPVIRMATIRETKIPIVSYEKQKIISELHDLMIKENELNQQLIAKKTKYQKEIKKRILYGGNDDAK
jgi:restriction endonuclease S subunit